MLSGENPSCSPRGNAKKVVDKLAERLTSEQNGTTEEEMLKLNSWMRDVLFGDENKSIDLDREYLEAILSPSDRTYLNGISKVTLRVTVPGGGAKNGLLPVQAQEPTQIKADVTLMISNMATTCRCELPAFLYYKDADAENTGAAQGHTRQQIRVSKTADGDSREVANICAEADVSLAVPTFAQRDLPLYLRRNSYLRAAAGSHSQPGKTMKLLEWKPIEPNPQFARDFYSVVEGEQGCAMPVTVQNAQIFELTKVEGKSSLRLQRNVLIGTREIGQNYALIAEYSCAEDSSNTVLKLRQAAAPHFEFVRPYGLENEYNPRLGEGKLKEDYCWQEYWGRTWGRDTEISALELPRASVREVATSARSSTYDHPAALCGLFAAPVIAAVCLLLRAALRRARPTEAEKPLRVLDNKIEAEALEEDEISYGAV
ncbi:unnamed protein product [Amoebophrya sp. A25]|nr:unnamed protein product [Amoebophrya sp. A25]|eukprot:GSA25T00026922001.1